jgi:hypothetical protein
MAPRPGERVLDVGCGFGVFAHEISKHGLEPEDPWWESSARVPRSWQGSVSHPRWRRPARAEIRQGDAYDFPLRAEEWGTFDIAHARFLLGATWSGPPTWLRPWCARYDRAGVSILEDDDHEALIVHPAVTEFENVWRVVRARL